MGIKVVVTKRAYYGNRLLEPGMKFDFPGAEKDLPSWAEKLGGKATTAPEKTQAQKDAEAKAKAEADAKRKAEQDAAKNATVSGQANPAKAENAEAQAAAEAAANATK